MKPRKGFTQVVDEKKEKIGWAKLFLLLTMVTNVIIITTNIISGGIEDAAL
jgi:hypothetical protein